MRRLFVLLGILLIGVVFVTTSCPGTKPLSKEEQVKERLRKLFAICKSGDYSKAGEYIVYRGNDPARKWKDVYNYENVDEKNRVDRTCARIKSDLDYFQGYDFTKYFIETESEGEWNIVEVSFHDVEGDIIRYYAFLHINGKWALGDID